MVKPATGKREKEPPDKDTAGRLQWERMYRRYCRRQGTMSACRDPEVRAQLERELKILWRRFRGREAAAGRRAMKHRKPVCELCGADKRLHAHHIDSDRWNNTPANIITLCNPCHRQIHRWTWPRYGVAWSKADKRKVVKVLMGESRRVGAKRVRRLGLAKALGCLDELELILLMARWERREASPRRLAVITKGEARIQADRRRRLSVTRTRLARAPNKAAVVDLLRDAGCRAATAAALVRPLSLMKCRRCAAAIPPNPPAAHNRALTYPRGFASLPETLRRAFRRAAGER